MRPSMSISSLLGFLKIRENFEIGRPLYDNNHEHENVGMLSTKKPLTYQREAFVSYDLILFIPKIVRNFVCCNSKYSLRSDQKDCN